MSNIEKGLTLTKLQAWTYRSLLIPALQDVTILIVIMKDIHYSNPCTFNTCINKLV